MSSVKNQVKAYGCSDVLRLLSDFVDGHLDSSQVSKISNHLSSCNQCEKFGDEFQGLLQVVRERLGLAKPLARDVEERLLVALSSAQKSF